MSTPLLSNNPTGYLHTPTSGSASRKRKAEEILQYPSYPRLKPLARPTAPTNPISPISHLQLSPQSSADALSSRIQQAIDLHFPTSETNTVLPFANDPLMDNGDMIEISHEIDLSSVGSQSLLLSSMWLIADRTVTRRAMNRQRDQRQSLNCQIQSL